MRYVLLIPITIGWLIGFIAAPIIYGIVAGYEFVAGKIDDIGE
jgi:hypothetical protein